MRNGKNGNSWKYTLFPFLKWLPLLDRETLRIDIIAGITAGVLILPQAIALATLAGMPPQYGLYTAIFPVIIASLWGSSYHALSGPNTALAVLTAMTIAPFANIGTPEFVQYAITLTFMVGVFSLGLGLLRLGAVFNYFSHTVMVALVTGVGIVIVIQQVGNFLGVQMNTNEDLYEVLQQVWIAFDRANLYAIAIGVLTVATGVLVKRYRSHWPHYIIAVVVGMIFAELLKLAFGDANTAVYYLGYLSFDAMPFSEPDFSPQNFAEFANFAYPAAISMAILGLMQSAVIARSMAAKSGQQGLSINQEVIGQGLSNVAGGFLSCFTSCGSFNRSAANIEAGARTPLAGLVSAFALAGLVFVAAPLIAYMPLPVMAGVLFLVGAALVKPKEIRHLLATKGGGRIVFVAVLATTLFSGVDIGVYLGVALSVAGYLRGMSHPEIEVLFEQEKSFFLLDGMDVEKTTGVSISGSLFFGSAQHLENELNNIAAEDHRENNLLILCNYMNGLDASGAGTLAQEAAKRRQKGQRAVIWLRDEHMRNQEVVRVLQQGFGEENVINNDQRKRSAKGNGS
jgi:SulP family sulfate permease